MRRMKWCAHAAARTHSSRDAHVRIKPGAELLIRADAPQDQTTALHGATMNGHIAVVRVLLQHGADAAAKDKARYARAAAHAPAMRVMCADMRCFATQEGQTASSIAKGDDTRDALPAPAAAAEALAGLSLSDTAPADAAAEGKGEEEEEQAADAPEQAPAPGRIRGLLSRAKKVVLG
jgi:ankyrin repeat protein